jgi:hypothetical protein
MVPGLGYAFSLAMVTVRVSGPVRGRIPEGDEAGDGRACCGPAPSGIGQGAGSACLPVAVEDRGTHCWP